MNRLKMLEISLDDSDSDTEPQPKPQPQTNNNPVVLKMSKGNDKFESKTVMKGMFAAEDDEIDYQFIPVIPAKQPPSQRKKSKPSMKIINEINYDSFEADIKGKGVQNKQLQQHQASKQEEEANHQEYKQENIKTIVFSKMLEIVLSDESSSEGKEHSNEEQDKEQESQQESQEESQEESQKERKKPYTISNAIIRIDHEELLQTVKSHNEFSRNFSLLPIPANKFLQLFISRNSFGFNKIWPQFSILFAGSNYSLFSVKKMMGSTTSNYYMTTQPEIEQVEHLNFLAKLRANHSGSVYHVFDRGVSPHKAGKFYKARAIQATIRFKSHEECAQPRQFQVFILREGVAYWQLAGAVQKMQVGLDILYEQHPNSDKIMVFKNRKPVYSTALQGYTLNFSGRVQQSSIKNFILQDPEMHRQVLMLGKSGDDLFRLDVSHPFSPCLAVCVGLANFDSRFLKE